MVAETPTQQDCLQLARALARRLSRAFPRLSFRELLGYGYAAAHRTADLYRPGRGAKLSTYVLTFGYLAARDAVRRDFSTLAGRQVEEDRRRYVNPSDALGELVSDGGADADAGRQEARLVCADLLADVGGRDRELLTLLYWHGWTCEAIARRWGQTRANVSRLHRDLLHRLRRRARDREAAAQISAALADSPA